MTRLAPRMKVNENGTVTISGLPYRDARSILTAATLWREQERDDIEEGSRAWDRRIRMILKMLSEFPEGPETSKTLAQRRRDVEQRRKFRGMLDNLFKKRKETPHGA